METAETRPLGLLILLFVGYTSVSLARRTVQDVYPLIPGMMDAEGSATRLGTIFTFQTAGYTVTKLLSGILMDQVNPFLAFITTLACTATTLFLLSLSSNWFFWHFLCTINGFALGISWPSIAKILRTSVPSGELATWWGIMSAAVNLAGVLGPWIALSLFTIASATVGDEMAWKVVFLTIGTGCLASILPLITHSRFRCDNQESVSSQGAIKSSNWAALPNGSGSFAGDPLTARKGHAVNSVSHSQASPETNARQAQSFSESHKSKKVGFIQQWRKLAQTLSPTQRLLLCCSATVHLSSTFLRYAISNWFPVMLLQQKQELLYSRSAINSLISFYELGGIIGNLMAGTLSDVGINHSQLWLHPRIPFILVPMGLASITLLIVGCLVDSGMPIWFLLAMVFVLGLAVFGTVSLCGVLAVELAPPFLSGTCHALTALAANVGAFLACYPMTWLATQFGWNGAFMCCGVFGCLSIIPLSLVSSMRRFRTSPE